MNKFEEIIRMIRTDTNARMCIKAPEDREVLKLCLRIGFGAVIDSAARQWQLRDPMGAFVVGPCRGSIEILFNPKPKTKKKSGGGA